MSEKSLTNGVIYSLLKVICSVIFPLFTFKYAALVLGASGIGKVEFAKSVVSYFLLLAGLGINTYAIRSGSAYRTNHSKLEKFAQLVFGLNCISCLISCVILFICSLFVEKLYSIKYLILIFSFQLPLAVIGVDWIFNILEDFKYIAIRTFICQLFCVLFLVIFVHNQSDTGLYAIALVIATYGANVFNYLKANRIVRIVPRLSKETLIILPSILILFFNSLAATIYVNSDITILGLISTAIQVGLYSSAVKIYTAFKLVIGTVLVTLLPRFSFYYQNKELKLYLEFQNITLKVILFILPVILLEIYLQAENLIVLMSGAEFIVSARALVILDIALAFSTFAMFATNTILLPAHKEKFILKSTILGATANVLLNLIFIPVWGFYGAAATTVIAEMIVAFMQMYNATSVFNIVKNIYMKWLIDAALGCLSVVIITTLISLIPLDYFKALFLQGIVGLIVYVIIEFLLRNEGCLYLFKLVRDRLKWMQI